MLGGVILAPCQQANSMSNDFKRGLESELRDFFEPHIFSRGKSYFREGLVDKLVVETQKSGILQVTAVVYGSEEYETSLSFNPGRSFSGFECTCPYDDLCKHSAAVGLAFIEHYAKEAKKDTPRVHEAVVVAGTATPVSNEILAALGGNATPEQIEVLIQKLQEVKKQTETAIPSNVPVVAPPSQSHETFTLKPYFLEFSEWNGKLTLHHKDNPYQLASVKSILEHGDSLTPEQKVFFTFLKTVQSSSPYDVSGKDADFAQLFRLAKESGLPIYSSYGYGAHTPLTINLQPEKLKASLRLEETKNEYREHIHHEFIFEMPMTPAKDSVKFVAGTKSLLHIAKGTISVHTMSEEIAELISRVRPNSHFEYRSNTSSKPRMETELTHKETLRINDIIKDARQYLDFTTSLTPDYEVQTYNQVTPVLLVDFSFEEGTLGIYPAIDYGCFIQNISESVSVNRSQGRLSIKYRGGFEHHGDDIIVFDQKNIRHAPIDRKAEVAHFKQFYDKDIGLNKTGTRTVQELPKIANFYDTEWSTIVKHCETIRCDIRFVRDTFAFEQDAFRADVAIDTKADNDWLSFDTACYCGPDRLTIADLRRFIDEGHAFFRREDGRLSRITNLEELARFVGMLESFEERENGQFEGKLYHAPEIEYMVTSSSHYTATRGKGFERFLKDIRSGKPVKKIVFSREHTRLLRPYQKEGVEWLYFLRSYHFAGILADDMGLGKTIQTLVLLEKERIPNRPSLVVCPKTLLYNWQNESSRFAPSLKVAVIDGTPAEREALIEKASEYDLLITGYATLKKDNEAYKKAGVVFNYCVLDEAQFIKNHATKNAQTAKEVDADHRLALTGTPLENSVSEIWSIFDFLMPGFLGSYATFSKRFHKPIMERSDHKALELLKRKVECFMLRRTKGEVLKELPPKVEQIGHCQLSKAQNLLYQEVLSRVKSEMFKAVKERGFEKSRIHILAGLMKLRQVCNHPAMLLKGADHRTYESAKLDMFNELVEEVCENKRKVLVFSQFTQMLDILAKELESRSVPYLYLSGKTNNRQKLVEKFNTDPSIPVFLISLKAGGTGLNLTAADTVIIFDPWWNPSVENQAVDRAHRIGQKKSVNVYRLITTGTIEEKIIALQQKKKKLFDALVGESKDLFQKLTWEDVQELFR